VNIIPLILYVSLSPTLYFAVLSLAIYSPLAIMSQSQQSDFASSLYDSEIDSLGYLPHSNLPHLTLEPPGSQQMFDSRHSDFCRPTLPPVVPSSLTHVGPDRRKTYVLYDKMSHNDWVEWWLQTDYGSKSDIRWDSNHQSAVWTHFNKSHMVRMGRQRSCASAVE
jgi:hypothetical protein